MQLPRFQLGSNVVEIDDDEGVFLALCNHAMHQREHLRGVRVQLHDKLELLLGKLPLYIVSSEYFTNEQNAVVHRMKHEVEAELNCRTCLRVEVDSAGCLSRTWRSQEATGDDDSEFSNTHVARSVCIPRRPQGQGSSTPLHKRCNAGARTPQTKHTLDPRNRDKTTTLLLEIN